MGIRFVVVGLGVDFWRFSGGIGVEIDVVYVCFGLLFF